MSTNKVSPTIEDIFSKMVVATPKGDLKNRLKEIEKSIQKIRDIDQSSLFGFERTQIQNGDATLGLERERLRITMSKLGYKEIDPSFLTWRKKTDQLPAYIIIDIDSDSGEFKFTVSPSEPSGEYDQVMDPELPDMLEEMFKEVGGYLSDLAIEKEWSEITIKARPQGFINDNDLRKKIEKAKDSDLFDNIYLIAEAPEWKIEQTSILKDDPIVVGWVEETEQMFVIGTFDLTPLEEHVMINHTGQ